MPTIMQVICTTVRLFWVARLHLPLTPVVCVVYVLWAGTYPVMPNLKYWTPMWMAKPNFCAIVFLIILPKLWRQKQAGVAVMLLVRLVKRQVTTMQQVSPLFRTLHRMPIFGQLQREIIISNIQLQHSNIMEALMMVISMVCVVWKTLLPRLLRPSCPPWKSAVSKLLRTQAIRRELKLPSPATEVHLLLLAEFTIPRLIILLQPITLVMVVLRMEQLLITFQTLIWKPIPLITCVLQPRTVWAGHTATSIALLPTQQVVAVWSAPELPQYLIKTGIHIIPYKSVLNAGRRRICVAPPIRVEALSPLKFPTTEEVLSLTLDVCMLILMRWMVLLPQQHYLFRVFVLPVGTCLPQQSLILWPIIWALKLNISATVPPLTLPRPWLQKLHLLHILMVGPRVP